MNKRQSAILDIINKYEVEKQEELVDYLIQEGYNATQATVSRDIKQLRLVKMPGEKKKYKYNGINFDSAVEIAYYIWLTDNHIEFQYKPKIVFYYEYNDKQHFYMPDFKVQDQYVEIKGNQFFDKNGDMQNPYDHSQDELYRAKQKCMELNNVKILKFDEYKKYLWI